MANCSFYTDKNSCRNNYCRWWNGACHTDPPPSCQIINNSTDCNAFGCMWFNNGCHTYSELNCEILNNQNDCEYFGCHWWNDSCHTNIGNFCEWLFEHGVQDISVNNIFQLVNLYLNNESPDGYNFIPTVQNIFGVVNYYLGGNGDNNTGCGYMTDCFNISSLDICYNTEGCFWMGGEGGNVCIPNVPRCDMFDWYGFPDCEEFCPEYYPWGTYESCCEWREGNCKYPLS